MKVYHTHNEAETRQLAMEFSKTLQAGDVIAYRGDLGAGKTTFTRGLVEGLGIKAEVSSPTFALVQEYRGTPLSVFHFDMYRVLDFDSLESTGFFDYLDQKGVLAIEWSEHIQEELPDNTVTITFTQYPDQPEKRTITMEGGSL